MNDHQDDADQPDLFPRMGLLPKAPPRGCRAWLALLDMLQHGPITHKDWLTIGRGWRLAAAIKELDYLGWPIKSWWVLPDGCANRIKCYHLPKNMILFAQQCTKGGL